MVSTPLIRPAISWGKRVIGGWVPLDSYDLLVLVLPKNSHKTREIVGEFLPKTPRGVFVWILMTIG